MIAMRFRSVGWWLPVASYIAVATGLVWTSAASAWYAAHREPPRG